jgi:hypothetical protein
MGRRRIRLMQTMSDAPEIVGVNRSPERRAAVEKELGIRTFATLEEAVSAARPQAAFLCTAPAGHGPAVMECIEAGLDVFMEINLIGDWYAEAAAMAISLVRRGLLTQKLDFDDFQALVKRCSQQQSGGSRDALPASFFAPGQQKPGRPVTDVR